MSYHIGLSSSSLPRLVSLHHFFPYLWQCSTVQVSKTLLRDQHMLSTYANNLRCRVQFKIRLEYQASHKWPFLLGNSENYNNPGSTRWTSFWDIHYVDMRMSTYDRLLQARQCDTIEATSCLSCLCIIQSSCSCYHFSLFLFLWLVSFKHCCFLFTIVSNQSALGLVRVQQRSLSAILAVHLGATRGSSTCVDITCIYTLYVLYISLSLSLYIYIYIYI